MGEKKLATVCEEYRQDLDEIIFTMAAQEGSRAPDSTSKEIVANIGLEPMGGI